MEEDKMKMQTRRKVLRMTGVSALGLTGMTGVSLGKDQAESLPNEQEIKQALIRQYGEKEANIFIGILRKYYAKKEAGVLTNGEFHKRVTNALLANKHLPQVSEDIKNHQKILTGEQSQRPTGLKAESEQSPSTTSQIESKKVQTERDFQEGYQYTFLFSGYRKNTGGSGAAIAENGIVFGNEVGIPDIMRSWANADVYGAAWGEVEFYIEITPSETGDFEVEIPYYRLGNASTGSATISLYTINSNGSKNLKTIEEPSAGVDGKTSRYKTFTLNGGETYELGFRLHTYASTAAGVSGCDFYHAQADGNRRRVDPYSFGVTRLK